MNSQKTPHTLPFQASYGVSFMSISTEIDRAIKGFYCIKIVQVHDEEDEVFKTCMVNIMFADVQVTQEAWPMLMIDPFEKYIFYHFVSN